MAASGPLRRLPKNPRAPEFVASAEQCVSEPFGDRGDVSVSQIEGVDV